MMFDLMKQKMDRVLSVVEGDLAQIKTGRAKPSLIEHISVEAYPGQRLELREVASISAPDPHLLVISAWDKSIVGTIAKALSTGGMGLNPVVEGEMIRIGVPPLTQERREELVKMVAQRIESGRAMMRGVRSDEKKAIEETKGSAGVSEDDIAHNLAEMQKLVDDYLAKLEALGEAKEKELLEV